MAEILYPLLSRFQKLINQLDTLPKGKKHYKKLYRWFGKVNSEMEQLKNNIDTVLSEIWENEPVEDYFIVHYAFRLSEIKKEIESRGGLGSVERIFLSDKIDGIIKHLAFEYREVDSQSFAGLYRKIDQLWCIERENEEPIEELANRQKNKN